MYNKKCIVINESFSQHLVKSKTKQKTENANHYKRLRKYVTKQLILTNAIKTTKYKLRTEEILTTFMTNKGLLSNQSINKKKRNNQLKLNKKLKQTFHRRGK